MGKSKLKTGINTPAMRQRVERAAEARFACSSGDAEVFFERDQWWVRFDRARIAENADETWAIITGSPMDDRVEIAFSVVDATGGQSVDGFDFAEVTRG